MMSTNIKRDILIHFDETSEELIYYTVDSAMTEKLRKREFDGVRTEIDWFKTKGADEAEKQLGSMIFAIIDICSEKQIKIRDYKTLRDSLKQDFLNQLELESQNSAEAKYTLYSVIYSKALRDNDLGCLEKAELLLRLSAELGYPEAQSDLVENWELKKNIVLKKIERSDNAGIIKVDT